MIEFQYRNAFDEIPILTAYVPPYFITVQWQPEMQNFVALFNVPGETYGMRDDNFKMLMRRVNRVFTRPKSIEKQQFERMMRL